MTCKGCIHRQVCLFSDAFGDCPLKKCKHKTSFAMKDKLKELIKKAPVKRKGTFKNFMIVSNCAYNGFWGENGFNSIILLGFDVETKQYVKITDYADVFNIYSVGENVGFNLDIPTEYGVPRIWFSKFITIDNELNISAVNGEIKEGFTK